MSRIEIGQGGELPLQSCLIFGASRSGKTHLCSTWPQVAMLCSRREKGYITLQYMDKSKWYDPKVPPQVYVVDEIADLMGHLYKDVIPQLKVGKLRSVCIELTFHADDVLRSIDDEANPWAKYANLENHVHNLDKLVKKLPGVRVVYNTLALPNDDVKGTGGVLIPGKALAKKLPAMCDLAGYMQAEDNGDHVDRLIHLTAFGNFAAGHRYGDRLPPMVRNANFRDLEDLIHGRARVDADGIVTREAPKVMSLPPLKKDKK
jgi:hypothetical protein